MSGDEPAVVWKLASMASVPGMGSSASHEQVAMASAPALATGTPARVAIVAPAGVAESRLDTPVNLTRPAMPSTLRTNSRPGASPSSGGSIASVTRATPSLVTNVVSSTLVVGVRQAAPVDGERTLRRQLEAATPRGVEQASKDSR
jgi:hypothetical protein